MLQLQILSRLLREPGWSGGVIAGDFNAIDPEDHKLVDKHGLIDAWIALHGPDGGVTWGIGVERDEGFKGKRLDKIVMLGLQPVEIEILESGLLNSSMRWTDHSGLRCTFTI